MATILVETDSLQGAEVISRAIEYSANKQNLAQEEVIAALRSGDAPAQDYFRYSAVSQVAKYLKTVDNGVQAVYMCDGLSGDVVLPTSMTTMIIRLSKRSPALEKLLDWVDSTLLDEYKAVLGGSVSRMSHLFSFEIVTDAEAMENTGWATVLQSIHLPPLRVS